MNDKCNPGTTSPTGRPAGACGGPETAPRATWGGLFQTLWRACRGSAAAEPEQPRRSQPEPEETPHGCC